MADFRCVDLASLRWFPMSRRVVPVTQIRVQVPPAQCRIDSLAGRYAIELSVHHEGFLDFVRSLEEHAQEHAADFLDQPRMWHSCVYNSALKASAFTDTLFFDAAADIATDPTTFSGCSCLLELGGAWTSETHWGLRWKVLELKACDPPLTAFPFLEDDDA